MSKDEIKEAVFKIVDGADLSKLTVKMVRSEIQGQFGQEAASNFKSLIKATTQERAAQRLEQSQVQEEEKPKAAPKKKKAVKPKPAASKKRARVNAVEESKVSMYEVEPGVIVRRNPGRSGRKVTSVTAQSEAKRRKAAAARKASGQTKKKRSNSGFTKPMALSNELAELLNCESGYMSRPQVVKQIRQYVKDHNLQDPKDGRKILFDEAMQKVFKRKTTTFFKIQRLLSKHIYRPEEVNPQFDDEAQTD